MRRSPLPTGLTVGAIAAIALAGVAAAAAPDPEPRPPGVVELLLDAHAPAGPAQQRLPGRPLPHARGEQPHREKVAYPVRGRVSYGAANARFGDQRPGHIHQGQDVFAPAGTPLVAVRDAVVLETGSGDGRGNYAALYSRADRRTYVYFHMQAPASVKRGQRVRAGRRIGRVGCTGNCFGDHLHFEVHRGRAVTGKAIDPLPLLRRWRAERG